MHDIQYVSHGRMRVTFNLFGIVPLKSHIIVKGDLIERHDKVVLVVTKYSKFARSPSFSLDLGKHIPYGRYLVPLGGLLLRYVDH